MIPTQEQIDNAYGELFDFLKREFNINPRRSQMEEIMELTEKVNDSLQELWRTKCDVENCNETSSSQGIHWREKGYWCICYKHGGMARKGNPFPKMKESAIEREKSRNKNGTLP